MERMNPTGTDENKLKSNCERFFPASVGNNFILTKLGAESERESATAREKTVWFCPFSKLKLIHYLYSGAFFLFFFFFEFHRISYTSFQLFLFSQINEK